MMLVMMMMMNKNIEMQRSIGNRIQYSAATRPAILNEFAVAAFRCLVLCCLSWSPQNIYLKSHATEIVHRFGHTTVPNESTFFSVTCPRWSITINTIKIYCPQINDFHILPSRSEVMAVPMEELFDNPSVLHSSDTLSQVWLWFLCLYTCSRC